MSENQRGQIVPFGKYRGQPVEVLAADPEYCQWLSGQQWFRDKFQPIYTVIINNFGEPQDTPEHNAMQVRFLSEAYRLRLASAVCGDDYFGDLDGRAYFALRSAGGDGDPAPVKLFGVSAPSFEHGFDVGFVVGRGELWFDGSHVKWNSPCLHPGVGGRAFGVEIKPSMGDDFPSVLRQMKRSKANTLVIGAYAGTGATLDEVRAVFSTAAIDLVLADAIEKATLPTLPATLRAGDAAPLSPEETISFLHRWRVRIGRMPGGQVTWTTFVDQLPHSAVRALVEPLGDVLLPLLPDWTPEP